MHFYLKKEYNNVKQMYNKCFTKELRGGKIKLQRKGGVYGTSNDKLSHG